jgi:hypothetical protein
MPNIRMPSAFRYIVAALCSYEVFAIISGKAPTLTELDKRTKHVLGALIIGGLAVHFYLEEHVRPADPAPW